MTNFVDRETTITATWLNHVDITVDAGPVQSISQLTAAADRLAYYTGEQTAAMTAFPAFGRTVVGCASASALAALIAPVINLSLYATIASPTFTGIPAAPTAALHTNTTQLATTAFVVAELATVSVDLSAYATLASPTFTGVPAGPTAAPGTNTTQLATTAFVTAATVAAAGDFIIASGGSTLSGALTVSKEARITWAPNDNFDISGVVASSLRLNGSIVVAAATFFEWIGARTLTSTSIGNGGYSAVMTYDHQVTTIAGGVGTGGYGIIGEVVGHDGDGKISGMYSRVGAMDTFAGLIVAGTFAATWDTGATFAHSSTLINMERSGSNVDTFPIGMSLTSNAGPAGPGHKVDVGILFDSTCKLTGVGLRWNQNEATETASFMSILDSTATYLTYDVTGYGSVRLKPLTITYDLVGNVVGSSIYVAPSSTIAVTASKNYEVISVRPVAISLAAANSVFLGANVTTAATSSDASSYLVGFQAYMENRGAGLTYGLSSSAVGGVGHTGGIIGVQSATTAVVGSATIEMFRAVHSGATLYTAATGYALHGTASGDMVTNGFKIENTVKITSSAFRYNMLTGNTGDFLTLYNEATSTNAFKVTYNGSVRLLQPTVAYDLETNTLGASFYTNPGALTVTAAKTFEALAVRPTSVDLSGAVSNFIGADVVASVTASAASSAFVGFQVASLNAGAGPSHGFYASVSANTGHTGTLYGATVTHTMVVGSADAISYRAIHNGAAGTYAASSAFNVSGAAAGDKYTNAFKVENTVNVTSSALRYNMRSGNTGDFLTLYDEATAANTFQVLSTGDVKISGTGRKLYFENMGHATVANRPFIQNSTTNGNTVLNVLPNGSSTSSSFRAYSNSDVTAALNFVQLVQSATTSVVDATVANSGTQGSIELRIGGVAKITISSTGNTTIAGTLTQTGNATFTGDIIAIRGQTTTFPAANAVGLFANDGSGTLSWASAATAAATLQGDGLTVTLAGFRGVPQNAQTGNYTLVAADAGKHIFHASGDGAGDTYTIPPNSGGGSVAFPIGTAVTFVNLDSNAVSIAITTDTMYLSSAGTTGTRTLAQYGIATALKTTSTTWVISGSGLT